MSLAITSTCVGGRHVASGQWKPAHVPVQPINTKPAATSFDSLTPRERQVLDSYMVHTMAKLVASDLGISTKTVEVHLLSVRRKSGHKRCISLARAYEREIAAAKQGTSE